MNGLEFLESLDSDSVLTPSQDSCEIRAFSLKEDTQPLAERPALLEHQSHTHAQTGTCKSTLTPGLYLLLREKGRRQERIKGFPPFPLLSINSLLFSLSLSLCVAHTLIPGPSVRFTWWNHPERCSFPVNHQF